MKKRTLYDCSHARVNGGRIYCRKGYTLSPKSGNGHIDIRRLVKGVDYRLKLTQFIAEN